MYAFMCCTDFSDFMTAIASSNDLMAMLSEPAHPLRKRPVVEVIFGRFCPTRADMMAQAAEATFGSSAALGPLSNFY